MKGYKTIAALLCVVLAVSFFGGCSQNGATKGEINTAYFVGDPVWPMLYTDHYYYTDEIPNEATVTVNGITYTGTFNSLDQLCYQLPYVFFDYKGDGFYFQIGAHDEKCYSFWLDHQEVEVCKFDISHGRKTADAIADDYISLNEYQVKQPELESDTGVHSHSYKYYREIDGIETSDYIIIGFDCNGDLRGFRFGQLGAFKNVKRVDIDEEKVKKAIEVKSKELYKDSQLVFTGYEIRDPEGYLIKSEADQCVLSYTVSTSHEQKGEEYNTVGGRLFRMVVIVDYEKHDWFKP